MGGPVPQAPFRRALVVGGGALGAALGVALRERAVAAAVEVREALAPRTGSEPADAVFLAGALPEAARALEELAGAAGYPPASIHLQLLSGAARAALAAASRHAGLAAVVATPLVDAARLAVAEAVDPFAGIPVALVEEEESAAARVAAAERVWHLLGAAPVRLSPEEHDRWLALTEQLPHLAAAALAALVARETAPGAHEDFLLGPALLHATRPAAAAPRASALAAHAERLAPLARTLARELERAAERLEGGDLRALDAELAAAAAWRRRLELV